ncbi:hypothetical protein BDV98DRAFT_558574 [Pterulicium gracile]|uniref:Uncharacterized protein n=1 Tax=Pterulicium gracile TaxID=1884261 RepID=A0A5C3R3N7_9AGAR|nr:hypothetical protein BDV98DRAFT_558574 [Pterula gracilis]
MSSPLEPFQRAQLTRSIHKLSKVLGTTPQLVDFLPTGLDADNQKRPAPLLLRHHSTSSCTPSSPRANTLRSVHNTRAARRRTIAKLSRTFGEAVPLELVRTVEHSFGDDEDSEDWNCSSETLSPLLVTRSLSLEAL